MNVPQYFKNRYNVLNNTGHHPFPEEKMGELDNYERFIELYTGQIEQFLKDHGESGTSIKGAKQNTQDKLKSIYEALYGIPKGGKRKRSKSKKTRKARKGRKATRKH